MKSIFPAKQTPRPLSLIVWALGLVLTAQTSGLFAPAPAFADNGTAPGAQQNALDSTIHLSYLAGTPFSTPYTIASMIPSEDSILNQSGLGTTPIADVDGFMFQALAYPPAPPQQDLPPPAASQRQGESNQKLAPAVAAIPASPTKENTENSGITSDPQPSRDSVPAKPNYQEPFSFVTPVPPASRQSDIDEINALEKVNEPVDLTPMMIVIDRKQRKLFLYKGEEVIKTFPVGVGRPGFPTPAGEFQVIRKLRNPTWENPYRKAGAMRIYPGKGNPLGTRWIGFKRDDKGEYGIHGTNRPSSVGRYSSHGCVRMLISDAEELFDHVEKGTPVHVK